MKWDFVKKYDILFVMWGLLTVMFAIYLNVEFYWASMITITAGYFIGLSKKQEVKE